MSELQAEIVTGAHVNGFANSVSDLIQDGLKSGLELDQTVCVAAGVCADYARAEYGDDYLEALCLVIRARKGKPLPKTDEEVRASNHQP